MYWNKIETYIQEHKDNKIIDLFSDKERMKKFAFSFENSYFDFSKNKIDSPLLDLLVKLANERQLKKGIKAMFSGETINYTEKRAVLHTALRQQNDEPVYVNGENIIPAIRETNNRIKTFTEKVISGTWKGVSGKSITDVVNIGIGGSDLGPKMIVRALSDYQNHLKVHYLSNIDPFQLDETVQQIDLETTLFVIVSKSFSTQETLTNARSVQKIYLDKFGKSSIAKHFVTISTQVAQAEAFGIERENIFPMWDWVGGRFSLWSPAGISIPLAIGFDNFQKLLQGAYMMDTHYKNTDFDKNLPVMAAFLTLLYNNFYKYESEAYIPYAEKLQFLPDFLQQLIMESNGKYIDRQNEKVAFQTGNIVWGNIGTNAQHSFFQLLHQGTKVVPVNFIGERMNMTTQHKDNHKILLANMIAQSEALMLGEKNEVPYKNFEGNRPSTTILIDHISPKSIGALIAYYEHKTFTEGWLWNINSFDQFGVELGKKLAKQVLNDIHNTDISTNHDASTNVLISKLK